MRLTAGVRLQIVLVIVASAAMLRECADDQRARVASIASACDKAIAIVALPLAGVIRR